MSIVRALFLLPVSVLLCGQTPPPVGLLARVTESADAFKQEARNLLSTETLGHRSYRIPEHAHVAIGKAAEPLFAPVVRHEVLSEYRVGTIKNDASGNLFDLRAPFQKDGAAIRTRAAARDSLDIAAGDGKIQKKLLTVLSDLGLLDVATNYGLMLLVFTRSGMPQLQVEPVGGRYFGAEEAFVFDWRQTTGGLLELRDRQAARHPTHGELWVRLSDAMPLRITAAVEFPIRNIGRATRAR